MQSIFHRASTLCSNVDVGLQLRPNELLAAHQIRIVAEAVGEIGAVLAQNGLVSVILGVLGNRGLDQRKRIRFASFSFVDVFNPVLIPAKTVDVGD
jgi:hypothetical protein